MKAEDWLKLDWLKTNDAERLKELFQAADAVRRENVGDAVHLRGLVEVSNYCAANCAYCGIRVGNPNVRRYVMTQEEVLASVRLARSFGYGTVVFQAGETPHHLPTAWVAELIQAVRAESDIAVTLSLGERPRADYEAWFRAGANRYLVRFETSNPELFSQIHPGHVGLAARLEALRTLRDVGFEIGSGVMVGVPGQTWEDLLNDIAMFRQLDLDMIGVGPFLPHPATPLGRQFAEQAGRYAEDPQQVPNDERTTLKVVALTRLVCPKSNIPATTALAVLDKQAGHEHGLACGANVIMPNVTPPKYRECYEIYPSKATTGEAAEVYDKQLKQRILALGRTVGTGAGTSQRFAEVKASARKN